MVIVLTLLFFFYQWDNAKSQLKAIEKGKVWQINYQLKELSSVFYSIEETLNTYEFPVKGDQRVYYQDAIDNDIQRLQHLGSTIQQLNEFPNFMMINENYFSEMEKLLKGIRGFRYTEEEKAIAIEALSDVRSDLYSLMDREDFSVDKKADREEVLAVLEHFIEKLSVLEKY